MKEGEIQKQIMDYLSLRKAAPRRYANRVVYIGGRPFTPIRLANGKPDNGHPDIIAKMRNATINIECKGAGKQSPEQKAWQAEAEARGEVYILARRLEDVTCLFEIKA